MSKLIINQCLRIPWTFFNSTLIEGTRKKQVLSHSFKFSLLCYALLHNLHITWRSYWHSSLTRSSLIANFPISIINAIFFMKFQNLWPTSCWTCFLVDGTLRFINYQECINLLMELSSHFLLLLFYSNASFSRSMSRLGKLMNLQYFTEFISTISH